MMDPGHSINRRTFLAVGGAVAASTVLPEDTRTTSDRGQTVESVRFAEADLAEAWRTCDAVRAGALIAEGFREVGYAGQECSRSEWLAELVRGSRERSIRLTPPALRSLGGSALATLSLHQRGGASDGELRVSDVWIRGGLGWQLVHRHVTWVAFPSREEEGGA